MPHPAASPGCWRPTRRPWCDWARSTAWAVLYALATWGGVALHSRLGPEAQPAWFRAPVLGPLVLAFLGGALFRSRSWLLGAPLGVMLAAVAAYLYYREPAGHDAGAVFLLPLGVMIGGPAFFVAAVGVVCGRSARRYLGRSRGRPRTRQPGEPPPLGAAADEGSLDEPTGRTR